MNTTTHANYDFSADPLPSELPYSNWKQTQAQRAETLARALSGMFSPTIPTLLYLPTDTHKENKEDSNG